MQRNLDTSDKQILHKAEQAPSDVKLEEIIAFTVKRENENSENISLPAHKRRKKMFGKMTIDLTEDDDEEIAADRIINLEDWNGTVLVPHNIWMSII